MPKADASCSRAPDGTDGRASRQGARRRAAGSPWGIHIEFFEVSLPPADLPVRERIRIMTQAWADLLADVIRRHPQDWHMLQRVFVEDLDPDRYAATVAAEVSP